MAELKTKKTTASVDSFINKVDDKQKRDDCRKLIALMSKHTKSEPAMWGDAIVGFGTYKYTNSAGKQNDWFQIGFSPRKQALSIYLMSGFSRFPDLMPKLGKYKTGKGCLYVKYLSVIDVKVLEKLIKESLVTIKRR